MNTPTKKQSKPTKVRNLSKRCLRYPRKEFKGFAPNGGMIFGRIDYSPKDDCDYYGKD